MTAQIESNTQITDEAIAEFLSIARSANVFFEIVNDHLTVCAVNPNWRMWAPIRHLLDEIGQPRIEDFVRRASRRNQTLH